MNLVNLVNLLILVILVNLMNLALIARKTFAFVNVMFQIIKGGKYGIALVTRSLENVTSSLCFTRVSLLLLCENVRFPVIV